MVTRIDISGLTKRFDAHEVLRGIDLAVQPGELLALLGPSGSGKTTLLRLIAGLERPDTGSIRFDDQDTLRRHPRERGVGFVFQHYALFRHMTVAANIGFGLKVRHAPAAQIAERVSELLRLMQLDAMAERYPIQLSGGQRQRVALARALAIRPRVLLLDEPFGALDAVVRRDLRRWLRKLHREMAITTIFVTHDQEEAFELADRVVLMNAGQVSQVGTPDELYRAPANAFVHRFLGDANALPCVVEAGRVITTGGHTLAAVDPRFDGRLGTAHIRPAELDLHLDSNGAWIVRDASGGGDWRRLSIESGDLSIEVAMAPEAAAEHGIRVGQSVRLSVRAGVIFFDSIDGPVAMRPLEASHDRVVAAIPYQAT